MNYYRRKKVYVGKLDAPGHTPYLELPGDWLWRLWSFHGKIQHSQEVSLKSQWQLISLEDLEKIYLIIHLNKK